MPNTRQSATANSAWAWPPRPKVPSHLRGHLFGDDLRYKVMLGIDYGNVFLREFFVEWRVESTADAAELPWGGGAILSCWSNGGVNYKCQVTRDEVEIWRDNLLPILFLAIDPGVAHVYRLELVGSESYTWFIDGEIVDSGIPEGAYPSFNPNMNFRTKAAWSGSMSRWDYIRYGTIPADAGGDFDSDGDVDDEDLYFFQDCLLGPDADGPGCRWADMNGDGNADGADIRLFVDAMLAP